MTTYSTDFSEYTTGVQPSDWTEEWDDSSPTSAWTVETGGSIGGQILKDTQGSNNRAGISWNDVGTPADAEVLAKMRYVAGSSNEDFCKAIVRGGGTQFAEDGYVLILRTAGAVAKLELINYNGGGASALSTVDFTHTANNWVWLRLQAIGTAIKGRAWADGDSEPGTWNIEVTNGTHTSGWVGVGNYQSTADPEFDFFSAGTSGDAAPGPPTVTTVPLLQLGMTALTPGFVIGSSVSSSADGSAAAALIATLFSRNTDPVTAQDTQTVDMTALWSLADAANSTDALTLVLVSELSDTGVLTDELVYIFRSIIGDIVAAADSAVSTATIPVAIADTSTVADTMVYVFPWLLSSEADASDTVSIGFLISLIDRAVASATASSTIEATVALVTAGHVTDMVSGSWAMVLESAADASDNLSALLAYAVQLSSLLESTDSNSNTLIAIGRASSTADATDSTSATALLFSQLTSTADASAFLLYLDDEPYIGHVVNAETGAVSWYTNVPFTGLAWDHINKRLLACKDDGIYSFDAADDAGTDIDASITTGVFDFQTRQLKRIDSALIGYTSTGRLLLQVIASVGGQRVSYPYEMVAVTADTPREQVLKIGKGLEFQYAQFTLQNIDGADFEIENMTVYPIELSRRRNS